jgi:hypothetical protein
MGVLYYGSDPAGKEVEDLTLAHLKVVIVNKLRRNESFTIAWRHPADGPAGRSTIWMHPAIPLRFVFDDPRPPHLDRRRLEELANAASMSGGIVIDADQPPAQTAC